jgi:hypothetical protein
VLEVLGLCRSRVRVLGLGGVPFVGRRPHWRAGRADVGRAAPGRRSRAIAPGKKRGRERTALTRGPGLAARGKGGAGARAGEREMGRLGPCGGEGEGKEPERERELGCWALFPLLLLFFSFYIL